MYLHVHRRVLLLLSGSLALLLEHHVSNCSFLIKHYLFQQTARRIQINQEPCSEIKSAY